MNTDVYARVVTQRILAELEQGERPWMRPWNAAHAAGAITGPCASMACLTAGINVLMLWVEAMNAVTAPRSG